MPFRVLLDTLRDLRSPAERFGISAERAGVSLNQHLLSIVATHAGSQAEAERYFAARAARSNPGRALEILSRAGQGNPPEPGDELPPDLAP